MYLWHPTGIYGTFKSCRIWHGAPKDEVPFLCVRITGTIELHSDTEIGNKAEVV